MDYADYIRNLQELVIAKYALPRVAVEEIKGNKTMAYNRGYQQALEWEHQQLERIKRLNQIKGPASNPVKVNTIEEAEMTFSPEWYEEKNAEVERDMRICCFCGGDVTLRNSITMEGDTHFAFIHLKPDEHGKPSLKHKPCHESCFRREVPQSISNATYRNQFEQFCFLCASDTNIINYYSITKNTRSKMPPNYDQFETVGRIQFCPGCFENMAGKNFFNE